MNNSILDEDYLRGEKLYATASKSKRFINYLIDLAFFFILIIVLVFVFEYLGVGFFADESMNPIVDRVISSIIMAIYYIILESSLNGKTIGKYVTKTRAVTIDGKPLTLRNVVARSFSRIVPFEAFSFLGDDPSKGWHDKWSDTKVIDETMLIEERVHIEEEGMV